jgi:hypothetical protein
VRERERVIAFFDFSRLTDVQLEKTHADMTKALQPTEETDMMFV